MVAPREEDGEIHTRVDRFLYETVEIIKIKQNNLIWENNKEHVNAKKILDEKEQLSEMNGRLNKIINIQGEQIKNLEDDNDDLRRKKMG